MAVFLSPFGPKPAFFDSAGDPLTGGKLYSYVAGSSTLQNTYTNSGGGTPNANPVVLNSRGEPDNEIWLTESASYKFVLKTSADVTIWTVDVIAGINDTATTTDQWVNSGLTPTYVSATQFTLVGDQTSAFHVGRRLKLTDSTTLYGRITVSAYTSLTTVTVVLDTGSLSASLSDVDYGLVTATNTSIPGVTLSGANWTFSGDTTMTGDITMTAASIIQAEGAAITAAATTEIWTTDGDTCHITGNTGITSFGTAAQAGMRKLLIMDGTPLLTHAANLNLPGSVDYQCAAGDILDVYADTTAQHDVRVYPKSGNQVVAPTNVDVQTFTSTDTWTKPSGAPTTAETLIEIWGAGGSGASRTTTGNASGGGAGGYASLILPLSSLDATETPTIGTGGTGVSGNTNGNTGGTTSFTVGVKTLTITGGTGGTNVANGSAATGGSSGSISGTVVGGTGSNTNAVWPTGLDDASISGLNGATGGHVTSGNAPAAGGNSVNGGGGGGGSASTAGGTRTGGTSMNGGNGGDGGANTGGAGTTGTAPSGGGGGAVQGGTSGAGADGQIRVTVRW